MTHIGKTTFLSGLVALFLIGLTLRLEALDVVIFNEWIARDFDRAFNIVDGIYIPLAGPEVNSGGRLPGPFMYFLLTIPLLIKNSYHSIFVFNFVLNIASIIGLFIAVKRFFNIYVAGITTGLVSISFISIAAVSFPINPSFLFPFITIFIWLLFEFALKGNTKVIPYIALTLALAVQFHYSIATYFLIPVVIGLIFRIKVPAKTILASLVIIMICISPYAIYKNKTFIPSNTGEYVTLEKQDFSSPWVNFKVLTLIHTFHYLTQINTSLADGPPLSKIFRVAMALFTGIAFYILFYIVLKKYLNKDWRSCKKETIALMLFGVPALLYGIANPMINHFWYGFIFIVPQALLLAIMATTIYRQLLYKHYKIVYTVVILLLLFLATRSILLHTRGVLTGINDNVYSKKISSGTFNNTQLVLSVLMEELNLRANEFYNRVYFNDFHLLSKRRLKMLDEDLAGNNEKKENRDKVNCFFVFDQTKSYSGIKNQHRRIIDIFLNDKSINIISSKSLSLPPWGFPWTLKIYQYQPIQNQSCYNNTFNPFATTRSIRNLLVAVKDIPFTDKDANYKVLSEQIVYDTNNDLELFTASYAVNNKISQSPFRFNLNIVKLKNRYSIKGSIESYLFFKAPNYDMKTMDIIIKTINGKRSDKVRSSKALNPNSAVRTINILTPHTLANFLNINNTDAFNYNRKWYREVPTAIDLKKGGFNINLKWTLNCGEYSNVWTVSRGAPCPLRPEKDFTLSVYHQFPEPGSNN